MMWPLLLLKSFVILLVTSVPAHAANIVLNVVDGPQEGFNDPTPVVPVTGNPGTTLGEQRRNVFVAAASFWEARLVSSVDIIVDSAFNPLTCTASGAALGFAGPIAAAANFPNAPNPNQIYTGALANSLAGVDLFPGSDINSVFNSELDEGSRGCLGGLGWDYRLGVSTGSPLEFFTTAVHELAHGLGFASLHALGTGALLGGMIDSFNVNLADQSIGLAWSNMTNAQRLASSTNTGNLVWTGADVAAVSGVLASGLQPTGVQMFAPNPLQSGSSVSHWDTALTPNELMEPFATANTISDLTTNAMYDMGWVEPVQCNGLNITVSIGAGDTPTAGNDVILGTSGADFIDSGAGDDTICAMEGADMIFAGGGTDYVEGGDGADQIFGEGGNDIIFGGSGADEIDGGGGDDEIFGEAGNDTLVGRTGEDMLDGGTGVDSISGGPQADTIFTGSGATVGTGLFVTGGGAADTIFGGPDADDLRGAAGADTIRGEGGDDVITGGIGQDELFGGSGDDTIRGQGSRDDLFGGAGDDDLTGGAGDDDLDGGSGLDSCAGQAGTNDTAVNCESESTIP